MDMVRVDVAAASRNIALNVTGDTIEVGADKAMVIGLIANELIWNAIRHAFGNRDNGSIDIAIEQEGDRAAVTVRDDGLGLPVGFDPQKDAGLGLDIIRQLVTRDIAGNFNIWSDQGTIATVTFRP